MAIHPTAIVNRHADIAPDVDIGPYCVIDEHVRISAGCRLYQNVYLTGWTNIEENCVLHPNVIVGHEPQDVKYKGARSYCRVGRRTILRENVTIHRGTVPDSTTSVGEQGFLLAGSHVGHNCRVGDQVTLINNVLLAGHVQVGDRATLGGMAGVHQFVRIGELCMIPGCARVIQDVPPFAMTDTQGRIAGLNRIGLRRAGLTPEDIVAIREIYRRLYAVPARFTSSLERLSSERHAGPCARLVDFLTADSRRGIAGRSRRPDRPGADADRLPAVDDPRRSAEPHGQP